MLMIFVSRSKEEYARLEVDKQGIKRGCNRVEWW